MLIDSNGGRILRNKPLTLSVEMILVLSFLFTMKHKNMIGFQGRALDKSPNKYITIMIQEEAPKDIWT